MSDIVRETALFILNRLDENRQTLDSILEDVFSKNLLREQRDKSLLHAIVFGVLRWRGKLDWIIGNFSKTRLKKIDKKILNILRIGLFQIMYLNRVPVSAAVNTSVEMAKSFAGSWVVNYVNAVLRRAAREHQTVSFPKIESNPAAAIAVSYAFPEWLIKRWHSRMGIRDTLLLCGAINTIPLVTLRTNTLKTDRATLMKALEKDIKTLDQTIYSDLGINIFSLKRAIADTDAFHRGWFQVQDEAAQLVTLLLDLRSGETVLDACAGQGGKTGHMAQVMRNKGRIMALDNRPEKLHRLQLEMKRLGIGIVETRVHDLNQAMKRYPSGKFDKILLDAPCSGLGVLRRNPDAKWSMKSRNLGGFHRRQTRFLERLMDLLKPTGTLVYAVCSTEPEEGEDVVRALMEKYPKITVDPPPAGFPKIALSTVNSKGYLNTFPHLHDMDGFFAVRLKKQT